MRVFWMCLATFLVLQISVLCTTVYLHRFRTHGALNLHWVPALLMHLWLRVFVGINPREWVAVHRKHHAFPDVEGDPHSPYLLGQWKVLFLNFFLYRKEKKNPETIAAYTKGWQADVLDRLPGVAYAAVLGPLCFWWVFGFWWGVGLWLCQAVAYVLLNSSINSLGHGIGYVNYRREPGLRQHNFATNLRWLAWLTGGEGLHHNHHEYQTSACFAHRAGEHDPGWWLILALARVRLAGAIRLPTPN